MAILITTARFTADGAQGGPLVRRRSTWRPQGG